MYDLNNPYLLIVSVVMCTGCVLGAVSGCIIVPALREHAMRLYFACRVLETDEKLKTWLAENDPNALHQLRVATDLFRGKYPDQAKKSYHEVFPDEISDKVRDEEPKCRAS